jgi:RNA polymerase-binding transcription factor DksA
MPENNHECILGLLNDNGIEELATLSILKRRIQNNKEFNDSIRLDPYYDAIAERLCHKEYTLADYADKRKSTNLIRFNFCPDCGKAIDLKKLIKEGGN